MKHKRVLLSVLAATVVVAGSAAWLWYHQQSSSERLEILRTATVTVETIPLTIVSSGNVSVQRQFATAFNTNGTVESVYVETGDRVSHGERLASLDREAAEDALRQAEIAVTQAEMNLERAQKPVDEGQIRLAQLSVQESIAAMAAAKASEEAARTQAALDQGRAQEFAEQATDAEASVLDALDRFGLPEAYAAGATAVRMEADGNVGITQLRSEQAIQRAQSTWQSAYERYQQASRTLSSLQEGPDADQVRALELALDLARVSVEQAEANLAALDLVAPVDGTVAAVTVQVGDAVMAGMLAITVLDDSAFFVDVAIDEIDIGGIAEGQAVEITLDAYPDVTLKGVVETISLLASNTIGINVYPVRVRLLVPDSAMVRDGMTANATIVTGERANVLALPTWAIRTDAASGTYYTYRVTGETVERVEVSIGTSTETWTEIVTGLDETATVALVSEGRSLSLEFHLGQTP